MKCIMSRARLEPTTFRFKPELLDITPNSSRIITKKLIIIIIIDIVKTSQGCILNYGRKW